MMMCAFLRLLLSRSFTYVQNEFSILHNGLNTSQHFSLSFYAPELEKPPFTNDMSILELLLFQRAGCVTRTIFSLGFLHLPSSAEDSILSVAVFVLFFCWTGNHCASCSWCFFIQPSSSFTLTLSLWHAQMSPLTTDLAAFPPAALAFHTGIVVCPSFSCLVHLNPGLFPTLQRQKFGCIPLCLLLNVMWAPPWPTLSNGWALRVSWQSSLCTCDATVLPGVFATW